MVSDEGPLITVQGLRSALAGPEATTVVLCDVRWYLDGRSGRTGYEAGHLPGAVFVDLDAALAAHDRPATAGRHPFPTPEHFARELGALGIGDTDLVVAYDDLAGMVAGRLVWMLRLIGRPARLLDGGLAAWDGPLEPGAGTARAAVTRTAVPWPADQLPDADETARVAASGGADGAGGVVLDARAVERYRGDANPVDTAFGHIPGARSAPFAGNLDPTTGRFRSAAELRQRFTALGIDEETDVVVSCGSGVSACHDLLALEAAGLGRKRLFVPSWSGWTADPRRPVATGDDPAAQQ